MFKRVFAVTLMFFTLAGLFFAREITFNEASIVAENWTVDLEENFRDQVRIINGKAIYRDNTLVAYVFDLYPQGYVIISGQDYLPPIKMYSLSNDFGTSGQPLEHSIMDEYALLIGKVNKGELSEEKNFSARNKRDFAYFLRDHAFYEDLSALKADIAQEAGPLLSTKWGQSAPYGNYVPNHLSGCQATSFAQIFNYYEWPDRGQGSISYYDPQSGQTIYADFNKEYEWWNMLDTYNYNNDPEANRHAVATLMHDVGAAIHMAYFEGSSSANSLQNYRNYVVFLRYSPDIKSVYFAPDIRPEPGKNYNDLNEWFNVAKNQIDNGWPCEYGIRGGIGAHSVVIDGYRISDGSKMVHINFGWGGNYNGYFAMNSIYVQDGIDFTDISVQDMFVNIYPWPGYKRPVGQPPASITVNAVENRSVFLKEYICTIAWSESPSQDKRLSSYIIYQEKDGVIEEIDRVLPEFKTHEVRVKNLSNYRFSVGVIDKNGAVSDLGPLVSPVLR